MGAKITGERVMTPEGGFNPTWQRHVAAYALAEPHFGPGRVLDLGCGIGHSYHLLAPRETIGVDIDSSALEGQDRETVVADMRRIPFEDDSFSSVLSVHSVEHVPDPERVIAEVSRVLEPGGTAVFVTPNRLTFGRPDEIIDPFHFVELDPSEMLTLCRKGFDRIEIEGIFGSDRYMELHDGERQKLDRMLRLDPLRLRRLVPVRVKQRLYDSILRRSRKLDDAGAEAIGADDFHLANEAPESSLDVVAICRNPKS